MTHPIEIKPGKRGTVCLIFSAAYAIIIPVW